MLFSTQTIYIHTTCNDEILFYNKKKKISFDEVTITVTIISRNNKLTQ